MSQPAGAASIARSIRRWVAAHQQAFARLTPEEQTAQFAETLAAARAAHDRHARERRVRLSPKTHPKLKVQIARFLIERLHGRPQTRVEVEGGASIVELLAAAAARAAEAE